MDTKLLEGVEQTLLIPLIIKAEEYLRKNPILKDQYAFDLVSKLDLKKSDYKIVKYSAVSSLFRSRQFDSWVKEYIDENPSGLVIEIGSGLDSRFRRLDNKKIHWINLDLPRVIKLRNQLMEKNPREKNIDTPLEKINWKKIAGKYKTPLVISEGVFPYLEPEYAKMILKNLGKNYPESVMCFDVVAEFVIKRQSFKALDKNNVKLQWGVDSRQVIVDILPNSTILDEWRYYDKFRTRNGMANLFKLFPYLNNLFRIYRIRFGAADNNRYA